MLRISKMTDYGALVMSTLARRPESVHNVAELADLTHLSPTTVSKVLKRLTKQDLVESVRGAHGGYRLARQAEQISMVDIITALEGPIALTQCATQVHHCDIAAHCEVRSHWQIINRAIKRTLDSLTLAELAGPVQQVRHQVQSLTRISVGA